MLRLDSSAISCSTVRTGTSWKLNVTGRPPYTRAVVVVVAVDCPIAAAPPVARLATARGTISTT